MKESKSVRLFISYSHKDEEFKDRFLAHLTPLVQKGHYEAWHDDDILVGESVEEGISIELETYDIIVFLVSTDFLASKYCQQIEAEKALERLESSQAVIFPVIIKSCVWKNTWVSKYKAIPKDGNPISSFSDQDEAWVSVIDKLSKKRDKYLADSGTNSVVHTTAGSICSTNPAFDEYLNNTEMVFQHRLKDEITLSDLYIYPDLKLISEDIGKYEQTVNSENSFCKTEANLLLLGEEQSGKTSLAKMGFKMLKKQGFAPILIAGDRVNSTNIAKLIKPMIAEQYEADYYEEYLSENVHRAAIIDDFTELSINGKYQKKFLENLGKIFQRVVVFSDVGLRLSPSLYSNFENFQEYEILSFGHVKRAELIEKWCSLGREETIKENDLLSIVDSNSRHIDTMLKKNIVPPKPIFILTILQTLESVRPNDVQMTAYGHCYQFLISQALLKAKIIDIEPYINFLTHLAFYIYRAGSMKISQDVLDDFIENYSKKYRYKAEMFNTLMNCGIIAHRKNEYQFSYKYVFYFYSAKFIADFIHEDNIRELIEELCGKIHSEKHGSILIFLTHHTKNPFVIDEIRLHTSTIFETYEEADLGSESIGFLKEFLDEIPQLIIEHKDVEDHRKSILARMDQEEYENNSEEYDDGDEAVELEIDTTENEGIEVEFDEVLAEINRSAKAVEIIGQIIRNRHGSLSIDNTHDLVLEAYSVGLRFLNFYFSITESHESEILRKLAEAYDDDAGLMTSDAEKFAKRAFLAMCYFVSLGVVRKIAYSVGADTLMSTFKDISEENSSPAYRLIELAIRLEFTKVIPRKDIVGLCKDFDGNILFKRLLQETVVQHTYMHHTTIEEKQWISETLELPVQAQQLIDVKSKKMKKF